MGLDGISVNQLRITQENNSAEMNRINKATTSEHKVVDGLSDSQKVDPDKDKEHDNPDFENSDELDEQNQSDIPQEEIIKYDLSDNSKYFLKLDEESNNILIIEKLSKNIVQAINADEMSSFVGYMLNSQGSMVNRKF